LRAARAERRLAACAAEGRRHISALARLQQDDQDQEDANQHENNLEKNEQG
jgi:hypothetical protein